MRPETLLETEDRTIAISRLPEGKIRVRTGDWEWTGSWDPYQFDPNMQAMDFTPEIRSILLGKSGCQEKKISPRWKRDEFAGRCCK